MIFSTMVPSILRVLLLLTSTSAGMPLTIPSSQSPEPCQSCQLCQSCLQACQSQAVAQSPPSGHFPSGHLDNLCQCTIPPAKSIALAQPPMLETLVQAAPIALHVLARAASPDTLVQATAIQAASTHAPVHTAVSTHAPLHTAVSTHAPLHTAVSTHAQIHTAVSLTTLRETGACFPYQTSQQMGIETTLSRRWKRVAPASSLTLVNDRSNPTLSRRCQRVAPASSFAKTTSNTLAQAATEKQLTNATSETSSLTTPEPGPQATPLPNGVSLPDTLPSCRLNCTCSLHAPQGNLDKRETVAPLILKRQRLCSTRSMHSVANPETTQAAPTETTQASPTETLDRATEAGSLREATAAERLAQADAAKRIAKLHGRYQQNVLASLTNRTEGCTSGSLSRRKEWTRLSPTHQAEFIKALHCLNALSPRTPPSVASGARTRYDDFIVVHIQQTPFVHASGLFLPFHRHLTHLFETSLRSECRYTGPLPYWDWTASYSDPRSHPIFSGGGNSLGGNGAPIPNRTATAIELPGRAIKMIPPATGGGCVTSGPFAEGKWEIRLGPVGYHPQGPDGGLGYNPRCLTRDLSPAFSWGTRPSAFVDVVDGCDTLGCFVQELDAPGGVPGGLHASGHWQVGLNALDVFASPSDPIFWLHHVAIDRVWSIWQGMDLERRTAEVWGTSTAANGPCFSSSLLLSSFRHADSCCRSSQRQCHPQHAHGLWVCRVVADHWGSVVDCGWGVLLHL